jgi:hypothetical protein
MYELIDSLNNYEHTYSVYPFGEYVHYTDKRNDFNKNELYGYLNSKKLKNVTITETKPNIEDTFMELAK